jgi:LPXTG-motif cell wall-anchored protein
VLIGLELMTSIEMYLEDNVIHAEVMFLVALTAVARKVVILDAKAIDPMTVFAIAALVLALSAGYYLLKRRNTSADG